MNKPRSTAAAHVALYLPPSPLFRNSLGTNEGTKERKKRERERRHERKRDCGRRLLFFPLFLAIATYHSDQNLETRIVVRRFNSIYELGNLTNEWDAMWHVS